MAKRKLKSIGKEQGQYEQLDLFAEEYLWETDFGYAAREESETLFVAGTQTGNGENVDSTTGRGMREDETNISNGSEEGISSGTGRVSGEGSVLYTAGSDGGSTSDGVVETELAHEHESTKQRKYSVVLSEALLETGLDMAHVDIIQNDEIILDDVQIKYVDDNFDFITVQKKGIDFSVPFSADLMFQFNEEFLLGIEEDLKRHVAERLGRELHPMGDAYFQEILHDATLEDTEKVLLQGEDASVKSVYIGSVKVARFTIGLDTVTVEVYRLFEGDKQEIEKRIHHAFSMEKADVVHRYLKYLTELAYEPREEVEVVVDEVGDEVTKGDHYFLQAEDEGRLTPVQKYERNVAAIEVLQKVRERGYAQVEEQAVMAIYSGWGGLPQVFDESNRQWESRRRVLKALVSEEEYEAFKESTLSAFYTPYAVIDGVYRAVERMGFEKGTILDPSTGTGNFIGRMPEEMVEGSQITGVELDLLSSDIARYLYPDAEVKHSGYEKVSIENNTFDLAVTNVPFGNYSVYDRDYAKDNYKIHDYFFAKSIDKVRAGGIVAFITSQSTMDNMNSEIRANLSKKAKFLGAIRLPNGTFKTNGANTEVNSDIIFLQKRDAPVKSEGELDYLSLLWQQSSELWDADGNSVGYNCYFELYPEMIVGEQQVGIDPYGKTCVKTTLDSTMDFEEQLNRAISQLPKNIYQEVSLHEVLEGSAQVDQEFTMPASMNVRNHAYFIYQEKLAQRFDSKGVYVSQDDKNYERIYQLVQLENCIENLFDVQLHKESEELFETALKELNERYDLFTQKFGTITSKTNSRVMKNDPNYYLLAALENIDKVNKTVSKASIFFERTIKPVEVVKPENLTEAMMQSFNERGKVDIDFIASVLERDYEGVEKEVLENQYAYRLPNSDEVVDASTYLSGNVRQKLREAEEANIDGSLDLNVAALRSVLPEDVDISDIKCQMGSVFINEEYVEQFVKEFFKINPDSWAYDNIHVHLNRFTGEWDFDYDNWYAQHNTVISETWGVPKSDLPYKYSQPDLHGFQLINMILNSDIPTCYDSWIEYENGNEKRRRRVNLERTSIARSKYNELMGEFEEWVLSDPMRRETIQKKYNELFNSNVNREYDGSFLTFPGMTKDIVMEEYQKNAIARMMLGGNTLLAQVVGAGKTFEMVAAGMEMKRLGIAKKPMYVVPNHLVDQWATDFIKLYPQANVLAITANDFKKENRKGFINRIATNNFDAVIVAHSSFGLIPISPEYEKQMLEQELDNLITIIDNLDNENRVTVKNLERAKKNLEAKLERLNDKSTDEDVIRFDMLGVDQLFIDEAHEFKNLYYTTKMSNISGIQNTGSKKAWDMYLKCQYFREQGNHVVMATGTPISNSIGELYTFQRYLQYDELESRGIEAFDLWAKIFGQVINSFEISVDGNSFKNKLRFNKFYNVPELMTIFREVAEIQTKGMLRKEMERSVIQRENAKAPGFIGGKPQIVVIEPTPMLEDYISEIVERTEKIHNGGVDSRVDNMLKVTTDSKKASIDLRLISDGYPEDPNGKLAAIASTIAEVYREYDEDKATQLVFCDSSTPKEGFNVYDDIKNNLMKYGIPQDEIAFIHDANTDVRKEILFDKVRKGDVRVLIGSTAKMGAGTNVQDRMIAVHHVDVPWRSSDIEQRNGRGFRQGNRYDAIYEFRYATKKSFDSFSWQIIENKSTYMQQLLEGTTDSRSIEDDSAMTFSYGEIKAIASGNPLIKEKMELDQKIRQLQTDKAAYKKRMYRAETGIIQLPNKIKDLEQKLLSNKEMFDAAERVPKELTEQWEIDLDGTRFRDFKEAGEKLLGLCDGFKINEERLVGDYCGFAVGLKREYGNVCAIFLQYGNRKITLSEPVNAIGRVNFNRIHSSVKALLYEKSNIIGEIDILKNNLKEYQKVVNEPFKKEAELKECLCRQTELDMLLDMERREDVPQSLDDLIGEAEQAPSVADKEKIVDILER